MPTSTKRSEVKADGDISRRPGEVKGGYVRPRWWIRFTVGPLPVRVAIFTAFLAIGLASYTVVSLRQTVDEVRHSVRAQQGDRHDNLTQNVRARRDDCEKLNNRLRRGLRRVVTEGERQIPLIKHAFPGLPPEFYRRSYAIYAEELRLFADDNCRVYALEALVPPERTRIRRELHW